MKMKITLPPMLLAAAAAYFFFFFFFFFSAARNDGETPDAICRDGWTPWLCRGLRDVGGKGMEAIEDTKAYRDAFDADLTRSAQPIVSATI